MNYTANDIVSLSAGKAFRQKIGMYLSADRQEAINLGLRELIVNVQDEYEVFKPVNPELTITLDSTTRTIKVSDNMRGIPVGIRNDGINSLTAAFLIPHSGGKHTEGAYSSAIGINGEGNKIVCHTAEWLKVKVYRDNNIYYQAFQSNDEGAQATEEVQIIGKTDKTGTEIEYVPDKKVYGDIFIDIEALRKMLQEMSMFSTGLHITLIVNDKKEEFFSKSGLIDGLSKENRLSAPFSYHYETDDCKVDFALQWVSKKGQIRGYANNLYMPDGGAFISGFKSSLTRTFNSLANTKYDGDTIRDVLDGFVSVKVKMGQFTNQQKTALANPEARTATSTAISNALKDFAFKRKEDFKQVVELLNKIKKAEAAAERARKQVLEMQKDVEKAQKAKIAHVDKLQDARKLGSNATLVIVEGESAGGSVAMGRGEDIGILKLRGKMLNLEVSEQEDWTKNEEVQLLQQALGIVYGKPYNPAKLRYGKVAIASDADSDGSHISMLVTINLWNLCPELIMENRLYRLEAPLYKVHTSKKNYYYYTEEEFSNRKEKGDVIRYKGLGQMEPEDLKGSMFSPEFQRLTPYQYTEEGITLLKELMGKDVTPKKDFVFSKVDFANLIIE